MFSKELEEVIEAALADGVLTEKERAVLHKRAAAEGVDPDELDVVIDGRLAKAKKQEDWLRPAPPKPMEKNIKVGQIRRCPNCGEVIPPGVAVCPSCNLVFNESESSGAYEKFFSKISDTDITGLLGNVSLDKVRRLGNYIQNYPVPNNRLDLLEFLTNLKTVSNSQKPTAVNGLVGADANYARHYWILYKNCIAKAKREFSGDPDFKPYFDFYEQESIREKEKSFKAIWNRASVPTKMLLFFIGLFLFFVLMGVIF